MTISLKINGKSQDAPDVIAAFAGARRHDPLLFEAYQGSDPDVIKGALAMAKQVMPAWKALREEGILDDWSKKDDGYHLYNVSCPYHRAARASSS